MASEEHLKILAKGVIAWNKWRAEMKIEPDLSEAYLANADLRGANLTRTNLSGAKLWSTKFQGADFERANLVGAYLMLADLTDANLVRANLAEADLRGANLSGAILAEAHLLKANLAYAKLGSAHLHGAILDIANFYGADLRETKLVRASLHKTSLHTADLTKADLNGADLTVAQLVQTNLELADLTGCRVYGASVWDVKLEGARQKDLVVTRPEEPNITVDDLEVAQFIYLLLNRKKLRNVLDTITSKAVLLLGRFTTERKAVLDTLADELRKHNLLPIIFDFERSTNRDFTETIKILAGLSLFVIVDLTKPKSAPQEVTATVPDYQIPFVPILEEGEDPYSMFVDLMKYEWVLKPLLKYRTKEVLLANFKNAILDRAWKKHLELQRKKNEKLEVISIDQIMEQKE